MGNRYVINPYEEHNHSRHGHVYPPALSKETREQWEVHMWAMLNGERVNWTIQEHELEPFPNGAILKGVRITMKYKDGSCDIAWESEEPYGDERGQEQNDCIS